jgi:hypothetical protein
LAPELSSKLLFDTCQATTAASKNGDKFFIQPEARLSSEKFTPSAIAVAGTMEDVVLD